MLLYRNLLNWFKPYSISSYDPTSSECVLKDERAAENLEISEDKNVVAASVNCFPLGGGHCIKYVWILSENVIRINYTIYIY